MSEWIDGASFRASEFVRKKGEGEYDLAQRRNGMDWKGMRG